MYLWLEGDLTFLEKKKRQTYVGEEGQEMFQTLIMVSVLGQRGLGIDALLIPSFRFSMFF